MSLLACVFFASFFTVATSAPVPTDCAGGFHEGDVVEKGVYWYKCTSGVLVPQGCLTASTKGKRVTVGESFVNDKNIEITCMRGKDDIIEFTQTACIHNNQRVLPGESIEGKDAWYRCDKVNQVYLLWKPAGCMYNGKRLNFFDKVREEGTIFECQRSSNPDAHMIIAGCTDGEVDHLLGEQYHDETTLYTCESSNNKAVQRVSGCIHNGQKYFDYQTYHDGAQVFRCVVSQDRSKAESVVSGCYNVMKNKPSFEKNIGCFWDQEDEDKFGESYLMNCKKNDAGVAYAERVRCLYHDDNGIRMEIDPGCVRTVGKSNQSVGCVVGDQNIQILTFPSDRLDLAYSNRLRHC